MSVAAIVSITVGVLAVVGVLFVISDVRAYNQRKAEVAARNRQRANTQQETEVA